MIKTDNLSKIFRTEEVETWALNNVNHARNPYKLYLAVILIVISKN